MSQGGSGGAGGIAVGRVESSAAARRAVDAPRPSMALPRDNGGGGGGGGSVASSGTPVGPLGSNGDGGGGNKRSMVLPEIPEPDNVEESADSGSVVEIGGTGQEGEEMEVGVEVEVEEEEEKADDEGLVHLFRVKSYPAPVWCEICDRLLLGVSRLRATVVVVAVTVSGSRSKRLVLMVKDLQSVVRAVANVFAGKCPALSFFSRSGGLAGKQSRVDIPSGLRHCTPRALCQSRLRPRRLPDRRCLYPIIGSSHSPEQPICSRFFTHVFCPVLLCRVLAGR